MAELKLRYLRVNIGSSNLPRPMDLKRLKQEEDYVAFLEKRANSANFKRNVSPEEFAENEAKLKKARLVLRMLKTQKVT